MAYSSHLLAGPRRHTRAYSFSLSLFTSFSLFRVLQHLTRIPPFHVLTRILPFPVLTRILLSQYSPGSHLSGTCLDFYLSGTRPYSTLSRYSPEPFSGTRPYPTFPIPTRTLLRYSSESHLSGTHPDPSSVLVRIIHFRYSPGPFSGTRLDPTFPVLVWIPPFRYSPVFYIPGTLPDLTFSVLARISTFPALA